MNFDRFSPAAIAAAAAPNWVEEIGAKIAKLKEECEKLDAARAGLDGGMTEAQIDNRLRALLDELEIAEAMLSTCEPMSAKDILIMAAVGFCKIDCISDADVADNQKDDFERDCALVKRTAERIIPAIEKLAGVTVAELGLSDYFSRAKNTSELIAAAERAEQNDKAAAA